VCADEHVTSPLDRPASAHPKSTSTTPQPHCLFPMCPPLLLLLCRLLVFIPLVFLPLTLVVKRSMPCLKQPSCPARCAPVLSADDSQIAHVARCQDSQNHWSTLYMPSAALADRSSVWTPQELEGFSVLAAVSLTCSSALFFPTYLPLRIEYLSLYGLCSAYKYPCIWPCQRSGNCSPSFPFSFASFWRQLRPISPLFFCVPFNCVMTRKPAVP